MLDVSDLECRRGDRLLFSGLSFTLEAGTLLHVRGRNGSGKTTLLRALCGLFAPDAGTIRWKGEDTRRLREDFHADTLYFGHANGIKGDLTGIENLRVSATLDGDRHSDEELRDALGQMGLADFEDLPAKLLSQGQKRRLALARLLLGKAPLWLLDEPFAALDADAVERLRALIARHVADAGIAILTTHREVPIASGQVRRLDLGVGRE